MTPPPAFTVILPVCHGGRFLKDAVESATRLVFPLDDFELIVIADEKDTEAEAVCKLASGSSGISMRVLTGEARTRSMLLNLACKEARGQWLVFSDDDCVLPSDWLLRYAQVIKDSPDAGLIGGVDALRPGGSSFDEALDWVLNSPVGTGGYRKPTTATSDEYYPKLWNMAAPREMLLHMARERRNGRPQIFDEALPVHEDVELAARIRRARRKIIFDPEICVGHCRDTTFFSFLKRNYGMARACRTKKIHVTPHVALASALLMAFFLATASILFSPWRPVLAISVTLYALLLLAGGLLAALSRRRLTLLLWVPALLAGVHFARGAGFVHSSRREEDASA